MFCSASKYERDGEWEEDEDEEDDAIVEYTVSTDAWRETEEGEHGVLQMSPSREK